MQYIKEKLFSAQHNNEIPKLDSLNHKDYGSAFEIPLVMAEQTIHPKTSQELYQLRHLMTFLIYFLGVLAIYAIAKSIYSDYRARLLAALFIIISPRLFTKSFYNSKDIVFMATIAISIY